MPAEAPSDISERLVSEAQPEATHGRSNDNVNAARPESFINLAQQPNQQQQQHDPPGDAHGQALLAAVQPIYHGLPTANMNGHVQHHAPPIINTRESQPSPAHLPPPPPLPAHQYQDNTTSPDQSLGAISPSSEPPRKRRRPALSCEPCRRRKVKCDRLHPCGPCIRMGVASACEYDNRFPRTGMSEFPATPQTPSYRHVDTPQQAADIRPRSVTEYEAEGSFHAYDPYALPGAVSATNSARHSVPDPGNGYASTVDMHVTIRQLQDRLTRTERLVMERTSEDAQQLYVQHDIQTLGSRVQQLEQRLLESERQPLTLQQATGLSVPAPTPLIRTTDNDRIRFWGPTHYSHLFDDQKSKLLGRVVPEESNSSLNNPQIVPAVELFSQTRALEQTIKARKMARLVHGDTIEKTLRSLPPREIQAQLLVSYLRSFEVIYRIFHMPSLQQTYDDHSRHLDIAPPAFQAQLLLLCAIGAVFADEPYRTNMRPLVGCWIMAAQTYLTTPSDQALENEEWIQTFCLLILARHANGLGTTEQTYACAGSMLRAAFTLGLHRDPKHFPALSPFRVEIRRRLWATVLELTLMTSVDASLPPLLTADDYDCEPPANIDDQALDKTVQTAFVPSPEGTYTAVSVQILLGRSFATRLEAYRILNDFKSVLSYDQALQLSSSLQEATRSAGDFFSKYLNHFAVSCPKDFHKHVVEASLRGIQLCLHRAFFVAAKEDQRLHYSRHMCLEAAKALIAPLRTLDPRSAAFDDYSKLALVASGSFKSALSLGAITIIILEVTAQLDASRHIPLPATTTTRDPLIRTLEHVRTQCLEIMKSGDPSPKPFVYLSVSLAMIRALEAGQDANGTVLRAFRDSLSSCIDIMQPQVTGAILAIDTSTEAEIASHLSTLENLDVRFDPSWLLTAWDV